MSAPRDPIDGLCMIQACRGVLLDLHCDLEQWADHYEIPSEALRAMMADIFIFQRSGMEPISAEEFAEYANVIIAEQSHAESDLDNEMNVPIEELQETEMNDRIDNWYELEDEA